MIFPVMTAVPLVRRRSLIEILWVDSGAPGARPVFPASSLFSLLASVNMAAQLNSARHTPQCTALLLIRLGMNQGGIIKEKEAKKLDRNIKENKHVFLFKVDKLVSGQNVQ